MSNKVCLRFYEELNDHLPPERKKVFFTHPLGNGDTVEAVLQAVGVPSGEVELVLVNGESVDLRRTLQDGDRVSVYPVFESFDITAELRVRPQPLRQIRFVVDAHLGKLAKYLRKLGFDTLYQGDYADADLIALSHQEGRILLSRDSGLLQRSGLTRAYHVRGETPRQQLAEVLSRFDLFGSVKPFERCLRGNKRLEPVRKQNESLPKNKSLRPE